MIKKIVLLPVIFYRKFISPLTPSSCRYHPTCSQYMMDAVHHHGSIKGVIMGTGRICRCHPFVQGGIDYVPNHFTLRKNKDETYTGPYEKPKKQSK